MEPAVRVLGPQARPLPPLPRWQPVAFAVAVVLGAVLSFAPGDAASTALGACTLAGVMLACSGVAWLEDRLYFTHAARPFVARLWRWALLPFAALPAGALLAGALALALHRTGLHAVLAPAVAASGLWLSGAALGSLVILLVDTGVSALVPDFRRRVAVAILVLLGITFVGAAGAAMLALDFLRALRAGTLGGHVTIQNLTSAETLEVLAALGDSPMVVLSGTFLLASLFALPAVLSASDKLSEAVMDRIHPLSAAFAALGRGGRDVRLEEGGSTEFAAMERAFNGMVESLALAERMERAFGRYVSSHVLERIRAQHGEALLPASMREASVLFADIRGFTSMSERLAPEQVAAVLNRYFERAVAVIDAHEGYLNKFIGDAVVVVFNAPLEQGDHAVRAVRCALALQQCVAEMDAAGAFPEAGALRVGVGVATGPMVCGNIGSSRQMEYTVIGDTVNLAARLTGKAGPGEVWVNERAARALPSDIRVEPLEPIALKGKQLPVVPWRAWPAAAKAGAA